MALLTPDQLRQAGANEAQIALFQEGKRRLIMAALRALLPPMALVAVVVALLFWMTPAVVATLRPLF